MLPKNLYGRLLDGLYSLEDTVLDRLILIALLVALIATGCATAFASPASASIAVIDASIRAVASARPTLPDDFSNESDTDVGAAPNVMAAAPGLLATLNQTLGEEGSIVLNPTRPVTITKDGTKITYGPGTTILYATTTDAAILTFTKPFPKIDTKVLGLRVSPELTQLRLNADNSGTAFTRSSGINLPPKTFRLTWDEAAVLSSAVCNCGCGKTDCTCARCNQSADVGNKAASQSARGPVTRPRVTLYTAADDWTCLPCDAESARRAAVDMDAKPYRIDIVKTDGTPQTHIEGKGRWTISGVPAYVWIDSEGVCRVVGTLEQLDRFWSAK